MPGISSGDGLCALKNLIPCQSAQLRRVGQRVTRPLERGRERRIPQQQLGRRDRIELLY